MREKKKEEEEGSEIPTFIKAGTWENICLVASLLDCTAPGSAGRAANRNAIRLVLSKVLPEQVRLNFGS